MQRPPGSRTGTPGARRRRHCCAPAPRRRAGHRARRGAVRSSCRPSAPPPAAVCGRRPASTRPSSGGVTQRPSSRSHRLPSAVSNTTPSSTTTMPSSAPPFLRLLPDRVVVAARLGLDVPGRCVGGAARPRSAASCTTLIGDRGPRRHHQRGNLPRAARRRAAARQSAMVVVHQQFARRGHQLGPGERTATAVAAPLPTSARDGAATAAPHHPRRPSSRTARCPCASAASCPPRICRRPSSSS